MFDRTKRWLLAGLVASSFVVVPAYADDAVKPAVKPAEAQPKPAATPKPKESATEPKPREGGWMKRHEGFLAENEKLKGNVDLLFVGDSITDGWRGGGKAVWAENYAPLKAFNIGIGGDRTQHVIWRLQNGEVAGLKPKLAVLMIGTNNLGANSNEEIVAGITGCVKEIQKQLPTTKVLLLGVFPRSAKPTDGARQRIKDINAEIAKLDDGGKTVKYLDIGQKFLDAEGNLPKDIMPDALHPTAKGYQIWAEAIKEPVAQMMK
jgi:beta-glucosidase